MSQGFYGFPNILGLLRATSVKVLGKAGATAGCALAGATPSGAPTSGGPFDIGDMVVGQNGTLWICTTAGTSQSSPGSFTQVGGTTSPLTTKGDVWVYGSADSRLGVGSDAQVLTADSTQSLGVKWAAAGAGSSVVKQIQGPVTQSADNSTGTLTSTTVADYPNLSTISITTTASTTLIVEVFGVAHLVTNNAYLYVQADSGSNTLVWAGFFSTNADYTIYGKIFITGLSAGAHTLKLRYKIDSGAAFLVRTSQVVEAMAMCVTEFAN